MKLSERVNLKVLAVMLVVCAAVAGVAAWVTGLNFWILASILVFGVLINGLIATVEDKDASGRSEQ
ncbi:hypothetical protein [Aquabacterium commune]|uniref:hypothetical protein n=1 Tax=Aquabacterium commune TaxID=70586 RepID=UPI001060AB37|nr:hypothetical protein [Aquabacterium commune]